MREVKFYNSLTNSLEVFKPIREGEVSIYVCGPTVYNHPHIGNARPNVVFDVLVKFLRYIGYKVTHMSNLTDVDDKIINEAIAQNVTEQEITKKYIAAYEALRIAMNAPLPDVTPRVTDYMGKIIEFINSECLLNLSFKASISL
jgi:cysteinyl-tRNA synthetase